MKRRTLLIALGAGVIAACSDATGPSMNAPPAQDLAVPDGELHGLMWQAGETAQFTAVLGSWDNDQVEELPIDQALAPSADQVPLDTYRVSFWATVGKHSYVQINYANGDGVLPFLRLDIPRYALRRRPNGSRLAWGERVRITVTLDGLRIAAYLEPSGLRFSRWNPARLWIWYGGADWDFNGDGRVDEADRQIEHRRLRLWYQKKPGGPWRPMRAWHSVRGKWFAARLYHFSGYGVSW